MPNNIIIKNISDLEGLALYAGEELDVKFYIRTVAPLEDGNAAVVLEITYIEGPY